MELHYKNALPASARELVDRIESFAGLEIQVVVDPVAAKVSPTDPNPNRPGCETTERSARIILPTPSFEPAGIVHELLHIERYWVEASPQVEPADPNAPENNWGVTSSIENSLEHLIIGPREVERGFDPFPYWAKTDHALWDRYPWPEDKEPFRRRMKCLFGSLGVFHLSKDEALIERVSECLEQESMLKEATRFNRLIKNVLHSKQKMLRLSVEFLWIPKPEVRVRHIDVRNRRRWYTPV